MGQRHLFCRLVRRGHVLLADLGLTFPVLRTRRMLNPSAAIKEYAIELLVFANVFPVLLELHAVE
jgi:hypothetical protein